MNFRYTFLWLSLALFFAGCSHKINEDKFILIFSDLVIAQDTLKVNNNIKEIKKRIFKKYNVSESEYAETLNYYNSDPRKWEPFFNKTISHLEGLRSKKRK
jgi:hypothetical protein